MSNTTKSQGSGLDINKVTLEELNESYGEGKIDLLDPKVSTILRAEGDMAELFSLIEAERSEHGAYRSVKDFIDRIYPILKGSMPYPALMLESLARGIDLDFPDGDSESMHYAMIALGKDYHRDIERRLSDISTALKEKLVSRDWEYWECGDDKVPF